MTEREFFFGIYQDIYDMGREDVKVATGYDLKMAEVYDALVFPDTDEMELYEKYLSLCHGRKVLELACGSGRITIPLAQKGYEVTGVDISEEMIERLKKRTSRRIRERITLQIGDITKLSPSIGKFDLIILPATSIRLLDVDIAEFIDYVAQFLVDGGYFIFDFRDSSQQANRYRSEMTVQSYEQNGEYNVVLIQEEYDKEKMKSLTNTLVTSYGENIRQYLMYSHMNLTTYDEIAKAAQKSVYEEYKIEKYDAGEHVEACFCILKK